MTLRTLDTLYTQTRRFGHETTPKCVTRFLALHPNSVLNLHLRHSCMFAYSQTGRTSSIFFKFTLLLSITKASLPPVSMTMFSIGVCQNRPTSTSLMLRHLSWFPSTLICCLQFLLWKQLAANDVFMTTCP